MFIQVVRGLLFAASTPSPPGRSYRASRPVITPVSPKGTRLEDGSGRPRISEKARSKPLNLKHLISKRCRILMSRSLELSSLCSDDYARNGQFTGIAYAMHQIRGPDFHASRRTWNVLWIQRTKDRGCFLKGGAMGQSALNLKARQCFTNRRKVNPFDNQDSLEENLLLGE